MYLAAEPARRAACTRHTSLAGPVGVRVALLFNRPGGRWEQWTGRAGPRGPDAAACPGADVSGGRLPAGSSCKATRLDIDTAGRAVTFERAGPIDTVRLWRQWRAGGRCRRDGDAESD